MVLPADLNANIPEEITLVRNTNFLRSDHIRFWFSNNQEYYASFKSVHLGDTGKILGDTGIFVLIYLDRLQVNLLVKLLAYSDK